MAANQLTPLIKTVHAATLVELLTHFEKDIYPLLKTAGLPEDILRSKSEFMPEEPIKHLLALMAEKADPEHYGNLLRIVIREYFIPNLLHHIHAPKNLEEAFNSLATAIIHDSPSAKISIEHFKGTPWFCRYKTKEDTKGFFWAEVFAILFTIEFINVMAKTHWLPTSVAVQSSNIEPMLEIFKGQSIQFVSDRNVTAIELSDSILNTPVILPASFKEKKASSAPKKRTYIETVYLALTPYLGQPSMNVNEAAKVLNTSARTLQRRLARENTTFKIIRENIMLATSCRLMEDARYSLTDISAKLGYADIAHFSRAFKKLTGFPPKDYRNRFLDRST
ncbi:helix-turn-helix transcriptional regulator [Photobacterium profundum]|uniref:helix-turn-helix transcriptional regulator n=1 Tax=Photobacterium profundum TaxID=74109 RepID=UPI003D12BDA6